MLAVLVLALPAATPAMASASDAHATVAGTTATLSDSALRMSWSAVPGGATTITSLADPQSRREWAAPAGAPDFSIALDSVPTSSRSGWALAAVTPSESPDGLAQLAFRYRLVAALPDAPTPGPATPAIELDRTYSLYPHSSDVRVTETVTNATPAALRVGRYSLAEITSPASLTAQSQAYHGGTDWRDDYRAVTAQPATFDTEGQIARYDDETGAGFFEVSERRGGSLNRVGRDAATAAGARAWAGVDNARDAFDWGPLMSSPPTYNRQDNPAYPLPVRQRTLAPLSSLDLGVAHLGVYHGGAGQAAHNFASDFAAHTAPPFARSVGLNTFHPWEHGAGMADANLRPQVDAAAALGVESFMLDDSWQDLTGDWNFRASKFPDRATPGDGVPDFVDYIHSKGMALALWMSPVEFNGASKIYATHPDWACAPTGDTTAQVPNDPGLGVWDVTNPGLRAYLLSTIDRLIAQDGVVEFKFDFQTWVDCPPHDYLDYEDAFVSLVRAMQARHPGVTFEFDETNDQRMWALESLALGPSWFDNGHLHGSTATAKLLHDVWSAAPWLTPSAVGMGLYDGTLNTPCGAAASPSCTAGFLMPIALLSHITFWTDLAKILPADAAETKWWLAWYKAHREALSGAMYEDTAQDPLDGTSWMALQPWAGDHGYLFAFRQGGGSASQQIRIQGVDPAAQYTVTDVRSGTLLASTSGAALAAGLAVTLPAQYSALVLSIDHA